jgi:hypothetical protein
MNIDQHIDRLPWRKRLYVRWQMWRLVRLKLRIMRAENRNG